MEAVIIVYLVFLSIWFDDSNVKKQNCAHGFVQFLYGHMEYLSIEVFDARSLSLLDHEIFINSNQALGVK